MNVLARTWGRLTWLKTRGARGIVADPAGRVLLVRHTYGHGWYLPGGGARGRETAADTLRRELCEETGITPVGDVFMLGEFLNLRERKRDTITVFLVRAFRRVPARHREIAATRWADPEDPPEGASPGTRRRLQEWLGRRVPDGEW